MSTKRRYDWTQVALVAVVGGLGLAAMVVLDVTWEKLSSIPVEQWTLIASALAGVIGTVTAAMRGRMTEAPARIPRTDPPEAER